MPEEERAQSVEYIRWCRDLFIVFERYGVTQMETVVEAWTERGSLSNTHWSKREIFETWRGFWRTRDTGGAVLTGWLTSDAGPGREDRIRRLAIDGRYVDPLTEVTCFDAGVMEILGIGWTPVRVRTTESGSQTEAVICTRIDSGTQAGSPQLRRVIRARSE
jgi:hypothetical protein